MGSAAWACFFGDQRGIYNSSNVCVYATFDVLHRCWLLLCTGQPARLLHVEVHREMTTWKGRSRCLGVGFCGKKFSGICSLGLDAPPSGSLQVRRGSNSRTAPGRVLYS